MTDESKGETEDWIEEKGAKYAYAYDKGGKLSRICGVSGIPDSVLVDARGVVVYKGHPASLTEEMVEKACQGALATPLFELPRAFAKVRTAITKGDLGAALKAAESLAEGSSPPEGAAQVLASVQSMIRGSITSADTLLAAGDVLEAHREYTRLAKALKGLPEEEKAKEGLARIAKDPQAKESMKLLAELEKLLDLPTKSSKDKVRRSEELRAFSRKHSGTFAAEKAKAAIGTD